MSTADSQLLVTASSMSEDIYKGIVKRDVVRIVTPGTVIESNMLDEKKNNFKMPNTNQMMSQASASIPKISVPKF